MADRFAGTRHEPIPHVLAVSAEEHWRTLSRVNNALFYEQIARSRDGRWQQWTDAWVADAGTMTPHFNSATLWRTSSDGDVATLAQRLSHYFDGGNGGHWHLWSPWPTPNLQPYGFVPASQPPLMVREPGGPSALQPTELVIREADGDAALGHWSQVFIDGFPVVEEQGSDGVLVDARVLGGSLRFWVGYVHDQPVTCAISCLDGGTVGVHCVATIPAARGRGYGAAITYRAATADPALPSWLVASETGRRVYERLGYSTVARYTLWRKDRGRQVPRDSPR